jgi:hypothetical protein
MARVLIIDRFEGGYAICEEVVEGKQKKKKDLHFFGIEPQELPQGAKEGDVLVIGDDGTLTIDEKATAARKEKIKALQNRVWED